MIRCYAPGRPAVNHRSISFLFVGALVTACSVSVNKGSTPTTKPVSSGGASAGEEPVTRKPIPGNDTAPSDETTPPAEDDEPTRVPGGPDDVASPDVANAQRAVCRIADEQLASLCHRALDSIADDNLSVFLASLHEDVIMLRPGADGRAQRLAGVDQLARAAKAAGGVRQLMHSDPRSRVVGTLIKDCRDCRRAFVAVEANTLAGAVLVTMDASTPAKVTRIELRTQPVRRPNRDPAPVRETAPVRTSDTPEEAAG